MTIRYRKMQSDRVSDVPVYNAMLTHRFARQELEKIDSDHSDWERLESAEASAWDKFVETVPSTAEGLRDYIVYALAYPDLFGIEWMEPKRIIHKILAALDKLPLAAKPISAADFVELERSMGHEVSYGRNDRGDLGISVSFLSRHPGKRQEERYISKLWRVRAWEATTPDWPEQVAALLDAEALARSLATAD